MAKLVKVEVLSAEPKRVGLPRGKYSKAARRSRGKLKSVLVPEMESPLRAIESLLIFDARCLDRQTQQELLRLIPQLVHIRRAWRAQYMECGCTCCHKKKAGYGAGGFCNACWHRIYMRMRNHYRKVNTGRDLAAETEAFRDALQLKYNAAQRLLNGDD
jgi:hypothetical protein